MVVCAAASVALLCYGLFARLWTKPLGWLALGLVAAGLGGTTTILAIPHFHTATVGLFWTFALLCILSITFYLNLLGQLGKFRMAGLLSMRLVALAMLVPMFFEPVLRWVERPKPEQPVIFLVDVSGSMSFPDVQNGPTRIQSVWQTLRPQIGRINEHFVARYFTFATDIHELKKPDELASTVADGKATDIGGAIGKVLAKTTRDDATIVVFSDGIDNTSANVVEQAGASRWPINTVRVGSDQAEPATLANVAVDNVESADDFVVGHESKVKVTIKSTALANRIVDVKMSEVDDAGKVIGDLISRQLVLQPVPEGQPLELPYKPHSVGVKKIAVWVDPIAGERSTVDNRQEFQGLALDPRMKVLYVEGRARPEYKPLKGALEKDPNIEVATLLRTTKSEFEAAGSSDGEPFKRMPTTVADFKKFDVIVLGDLDASFLSAPQQLALEQFVNEGGGFLMIGGQNNFGPGGYKDKDIERLLPVFAGELTSPQEKTQFVPRLTAEGATHPAMEGLSEWFGVEGVAGTKNLPPLRGNVVVPKAKSGAQVLLFHPGRAGPDGKDQIILAVQRYGKGRTAAFTSDTTYLWYLPLAGMGQESPYKRFWGQLVRWLAGEDVRNRQHGAGVDALLNKSLYQLGENVRVRAMVRDERGDATKYAQVSLKVRKVSGKDGPGQTLAPVEAHQGLYETTIATPDKGDWEVDIVAMKDGKELGKRTIRFTVIPPADEMLKIAANPELLVKIAGKTRGYPYELAQLPALIDELVRNEKTTTTARQETLPMSNFIRVAAAMLGRHPDWAAKFDLPVQAGLVFVMLLIEWTLRRRWQLP